MRHFLPFCIFVCCAVLQAYEKPFPKYIVSDVTWIDAKTKTEKTMTGQLWFADIPVIDASGKTRGFGRLGNLNGIKWFVPKNPGDIWFQKVTDAKEPNTFLLHDHYGEYQVRFAFSAIKVFRSGDSLMVDSVGSLEATAAPKTAADKKLDALLGINTEDDELTESIKVAEAVDANSGRHLVKTNLDDKTPLYFALDTSIGIKAIPIENLVKIVFKTASDNLSREMYTGRFVQYSNTATGDEGRVNLMAATFFGGKESERFTTGDFLGDDSILMSGTFHDLSFIAPDQVALIGGTDPASDTLQPVEKMIKKRKTIVYPRDTPVFVHFSKDLTKILSIQRLPWGTGTIIRSIIAPDGSTYLTGYVGENYQAITTKPACQKQVEKVASTDSGNKKSAPDSDSFLLKFTPDRKSIVWAIRFKEGVVDPAMRPDGKMFCRRGNEVFFITPDGAIEPGPKLEVDRGNMAVCPKTGAIYFGGNYRSATGLEPYVCPVLYKVDANGKTVWTAYGWTGPIVGVQQFRLVSDSSISRVSVAENGNLSLIGWSDGGNTVLMNQPYDMRLPAKGGGFCDQLWGSKGGLSVRHAHIISMNTETMEAEFHTSYTNYLPCSDVPTILNLYGIQRMPNGDVALCGGGAIGYVETHDAWVKSWYIEHQTDEFARAKSGTFFTLLTPDFKKPRMATRIPGTSGHQINSKGNLVLLYAGATDAELNGPPVPRDTPPLATLIKNAVQAKNGGGMDAYVMLIDTQGKPNPPVIPAKTWGLKK